MMRIALVAVLLAAAVRPSAACAMKSNELVVVLGTASGEPVTVHISMSEDETGGAWTGTAMLHLGTREIVVGSLDPTAVVNVEVDRLIAAARKQAQAQATLVPATLVSTTACRSSRRCAGVSLARDDTQLRAGTTTLTLPAGTPDSPRKLVGVATYRAGAKTILVANVGSGDPKFAQTVRACDGMDCRDFVTLHHGDQSDFVLVK
jgi:hypothetical protein